MLCLIAGDLHTLHIHGELICYVITANGGVNQFSTVGCVPYLAVGPISIRGRCLVCELGLLPAHPSHHGSLHTVPQALITSCTSRTTAEPCQLRVKASHNPQAQTQ